MLSFSLRRDKLIYLFDQSHIAVDYTFYLFAIFEYLVLTKSRQDVWYICVPLVRTITLLNEISEFMEGHFQTFICPSTTRCVLSHRRPRCIF